MTILLAVLLVSVDSTADERVYQAAWCSERKGIVEFVLPDRTRVDCLTDVYAVEVDHAKNWMQAIGQSLYYASWTGRRAAIVLITAPGEERFLTRARRVIGHYGLPIDIFVVRP